MSDEQGAADFAAALRALPDVASVIAFDDPPPCRTFQLKISQPSDHDDVASPRFLQKVYLTHCSSSAPVVFSPTGYGLSDGFTREELTTELGANEIVVEHRYFGSSTPNVPDGEEPYRFLTVREAAADHHRIVEILKAIYPQTAWISTGTSKGGLAATFHRWLYPGDVAGSVVYVAPFMVGAPDGRFSTFFETVPEPACRDATRSFQREVLGRRAELEALMGAEMFSPFQRLGVSRALDYTVMGYSWNIWTQGRGGACGTTPPVGASAADLYSTLMRTGALSASTDATIEALMPFSIQSVRELGYAQMPTAGLEDLLRFTWEDCVKTIVGDLPSTYDSSTVEAARRFVHDDARRMIFIYGGKDPWTLGAPDLGALAPSRSVKMFVAPDDDHHARIGSLSASERDVVRATLADWVASPR